MARIYNFNDKVKIMKVSVYDVARAFLYFDSMQHKKIQKLCYYAYAWFYTLYQRRLFSGQFEAWIHGPVHNGLYQNYKNCGWTPIPRESQLPNSIDNDTFEFIQLIYDTYGDFDADQLEALTHGEEPWIVARNGLPECEPSRNPIKDEVILNYYRKVLESGQTE